MISTEYKVPGLSKKIALVTDLHEYDPRAVIRLLREAMPDMICVAGDTFERYDSPDNPGYAGLKPAGLMWLIKHWLYSLGDIVNRFRGSVPKPENAYLFLQEASKIAPVYVSLGNHEWYLTKKDRYYLNKYHVTLLDNQDTVFEDLLVGGLSTNIDETWLEKFAEKEGYKLLLCHHPEYFDMYLKDKQVDLILSGHVHGGQIRIAGHGLLCPDQGLLPRYHHGIYQDRLVVSAGCSNTIPFPRIGNPTELVLLIPM